MDNSNDEFEPLFDYTRVQPAPVICLGDDLDGTPDFASKKRRISDTTDEKKQDVNSKDVKVIDCDGKEEEEEEDWLPPPPKNLDTNSKSIGEDSTLKALSAGYVLQGTLASLIHRLERQELASFAQSADDVVRAVEESPVEPQRERAKLVISIQDKDELKQFRVYIVALVLHSEADTSSMEDMLLFSAANKNKILVLTKSIINVQDDKFERLFKIYADKTKLDVKNLVFCFDGDKVTPDQTPNSLGMEENDILEVHVKSS
ncbi:hypothetical protein SASPL_140368 [Salvia splendens]|uniref:Rad60/SUMO-like domain-containing protein n=1 Tax=Salvia splendens TaxID=180675 RepID=A0A8X8ZBU3_SALSN|nr:hypothetical protein SASPL_140368 [Salvia splendens]